MTTMLLAWPPVSLALGMVVGRAMRLRDALARCRYLAIKAGVNPDDLPDDPTDTQTS